MTKKTIILLGFIGIKFLLQFLLLSSEYDLQRDEYLHLDQADLLNRTLQFFKENQHFDQDSFNTEVLHHKELINGFEKYKKQYEGESKLILEDNFPISPAAVKKQNRIFKSIIKLDKNFHIYIHGDRNRIEHGEDEKGRYYKLYFNTES